MSAAPPIRMTKPRISAIILEGTATVVSAVLAVWLLSWLFPPSGSRKAVEAFYVRNDVPAEEVPFQAADVRLLSGEAREAQIADRLAKSIEGCLGRGEPVVIYVSAPVIGNGAGAKIGDSSVRKLIEDIAERAEGDVLLALDLAQIDTDRDLCVFGNGPLADLDEVIKGLKPRGRLSILTSAAPAQKSWSADGLGHSIFAYYLHEGLAGGAIGWDGPTSDASRRAATITDAGLHRYILHHVRQWVKVHRKSVQTPMLLSAAPAKGKAGPIALRIAAGPSTTTKEPTDARQAPPAVELAKADGPAEKKDQGSQPPASIPDRRETAMTALMDEWGRHEALRSRQRAYEYHPGAWRAYRSALLRAERRLRIAWFSDDPEALEQAGQGLGQAIEARAQLEKRLKERRDAEQARRFRPVAGEGEVEGRQQLGAALVYLTGGDLPGLAPEPPRKEKGDPQTAPGAAQAQAAKPTGPEPPPSALEPITPETYLELQLPAWAYRFEKEFHKPGYFKSGGEYRGTILRDLVKARADAEQAVSRGRCGLAWIEPIIERGDGERRIIQDQVLTGDVEDRVRDAWKDAVERVGKNYKLALEWGTKVRDARATFELAAAELPALAEWDIRARSYDADSSRGPSASYRLPETSDAALTTLRRLARLVDLRPDKDASGFDVQAANWFRDLDDATKEMGKRLDELNDRLGKSIDTLVSDEAPWTALDAALRTTLIRPEQRGVLLRKSFNRESASKLDPGHLEGPAGRVDLAPDPGFWARAAGMSRLDLMLDDIAAGPEAAAVQELALKGWQTAMAQAGTYRASPGGPEDSLGPFPDFTAAVKSGGKELLTDPNDPAEARSREVVEAASVDKERRARLLDAWKLDRVRPLKVDEAVDAYWQFCRYALLDLQFRRLREDYADASVLAGVARDLADLANSKALAIAFKPASLPSGSLRIRVAPRDKLRLKEWQGPLSVDLLEPREQDGYIPPGQAFIGVVLPGGLDIRGGSTEDGIPGRLVPVGGPADGDPPARHDPYQLIEQRYGANKTLPVEAKVFYRGRVDRDSSHAVEVLPTEAADLVKITIGANRSAWEIKYGKEVAKGIVDQFKNHQHQGYMHLGKELDYLLTFRNQTPWSLHLRCVIKLVDPAAPQASEDDTTIYDQPWDPGPKGSNADTMTYPGKVSLSRTRPGETRELRVTLSPLDPTGQIDKSLASRIPPFKVLFRQQTVDDYMHFGVRFNQNCDEHLAKGKGNTRCFIVVFTRRDDDAFTEPIRPSEWRCEMSGKSPGSAEEGWIFPGTAYFFHFYDYPSNMYYKWSGTIENEEVEGDSKEDLKRKKP